LAVRCIVQKSRLSLNVKVKGEGHIKLKTPESSPLTMHTKACIVGHAQQAVADDTIA